MNITGRRSHHGLEYQMGHLSEDNIREFRNRHSERPTGVEISPFSGAWIRAAKEFAHGFNSVGVCYPFVCVVDA